MTTVRAKRFAYAVSVDREGAMTAEEDGTPVPLGDEWTADHLLLASVVRCSIASLVFHARRIHVDVTASGAATGTVTKPEDEERYRFVEVDVVLDVELDPPLEGEALGELLAKAERDCFVGASLKAKPAYRWRVNQ